MINESVLPDYVQAANDYLAGKEISTGFFSKIKLPDVPDNVALIPINGVMTKADVCGATGTRSLTALLNQAVSDPSIDSIILYFESVPGGQVDGTKVFADAIKAASLKKPVLSAISGMSCSAGYWAASQTTEIYATSPTDMIGCIGVMTKMQKGAADENVVTVVSDLSPDKNAEFKDETLLKQSFLNPLAEMFQKGVTEGRGNNLKVDSKGVLSGATFLAPMAKKNGLIDGVMPFEKIVMRANYLSKKSKNMDPKNTATADNFKFQNVLKVANATAFAPVEEGFAVTEEQLNAIDASIGEMATTIATNDTAITEAGEALTAAQATITSQTEEITRLKATVEKYKVKPAPAAADPSASSDKVDDPKLQFRTSVDDEAERMTK